MASHRVHIPRSSRKARVAQTRALPFPRILRRAFSLIEVSCVVLVIGIVAAIGIPRFADSNSQYRIETAAKRIQADIAMAQDLARSLSISHNAVFKPGSTAYVIEPASTDPTPMEIAQSGARVTDLSMSPFNCRVMKAKFGTDSTLTFDAFGTPVAGGHLVIYANNWGALIRVSEGVGRVDITLFRVSSPPVAVVAVTGPMDVVTRSAKPEPTVDLVERTRTLGGGTEITALNVMTVGVGTEAEVDRTTVIDP